LLPGLISALSSYRDLREIGMRFHTEMSFYAFVNYWCSKPRKRKNKRNK